MDPSSLPEDWPFYGEPGRFKNGKTCLQCVMALRSRYTRCGKHLDDRERWVVDTWSRRVREAREERSAAYENRRRPLQIAARERILSERPHVCQACGAECSPAGLDVDHIVPVVDIVRAFGDDGFAKAYLDVNMWLLCKPCHQAKTKGPLRRVPSYEELLRPPLQYSRWASILHGPDWKQRSEAEVREILAGKQSGVEDRARRIRLVNEAVAARRDSIVDALAGTD